MKTFKKSLVFTAMAAASGAVVAAENEQPNIVVIVGDDVGFADTQPYGSEVATPNLMELAEEGVKFTNFHASPTSSVTRSMMLTGANSHEVGLGTFDYAVYPDAVGKPGYEGFLTKKGVTVATLLKESGYHTYMAGKWHLGHEDGFLPDDRGFEESYGILAGGSNHFNRDMMFPAKNAATAQALQKGEVPGVEVEPTYRNGEVVADEYKGQYSDQVYTDEIIKMIESNRKDGKPFFAYVPFTAIHLPLQAPEAAYADKVEYYAEHGWDSVREDRFNRMKEMGVIPKDASMSDRNALSRPWDSLTQKEQQWYGKKMAVAMGMMELQDQQIGQIVDYLKSIDEYDNTYIMYLADNGPEAADITGENISDLIRTWTAHHFDNSVENLGKANSSVSLGPEWASASTGGLSWYKAYTAEGGIRVPFIVKPAKELLEGDGALKPGTQTNDLSQVKDVAATILEIAEVEHPGTTYKGRKVAPMSGVSLLPYFEGKTETVHTNDNPIPFELFGSGILLKGDYKIIRISTGMGGDSEWHMYNTKTDPAEQHDLRDKKPILFREMLADYQSYEREQNIIPVDERWNPFENVK
ncbi:arylsulfatase [Vibrio coralliilyticus]|uniref:arylsulfatase n=1 Tax=Vibrio TaxID=662 RepID=UPI000BAC2688|nr:MULTISPECIES: arylsulfatase [Vibrio]NOI77390.1 arylsulfatase [Vibrio coralliilyticus]PAW02899.1 arylsulfatase [Vibrio coralliilyticus]